MVIRKDIKGNSTPKGRENEQGKGLCDDRHYFPVVKVVGSVLRYHEGRAARVLIQQRHVR